MLKWLLAGVIATYFAGIIAVSTYHSVMAPEARVLIPDSPDGLPI
jgi:hypothetical protein